MKVLVTGHLGYIGCVLTPMLVARGHDVHGLDSDMYRNCTFFGSVPDVPAAIKDVRDVEAADLYGFDVVIHSDSSLGEGVTPPVP